MKHNNLALSILMLLFGNFSTALEAQTPEAPVGKVWILNPDMSDEFDANGPGDMWDVFDKADSWDRTAAFDKRVHEIQVEEENGEANYILAMNPMWYEEEDIFTKNGRTYYFAGGGMRTQARTTYGYMEVRIKPSNFPMGSGVFMFSNPSDDPCGEKYSTELDIIENMSYDGPDASETWNGYQHVNTHVWPTDENCNRLSSNMHGGNKQALEGPLDFNVVGAWWKSKDSVDFFLNGRYWHSVEFEADFDLSMPLILTMETYTWGSDENNADNPKPEEYMFQDDFRTPEERAVYYDWVRTWKLVDIDTSEFNNDTDNLRFFKDAPTMYEDSILDFTLLYSATEERELVVAVYNAAWELLGSDTLMSELGVKSMLAKIEADTILGAGTDYKAVCCLKPLGGDESSVLAADTVQLIIETREVETLLFDDGFPKQVYPSSTGYMLDVHYQGAEDMEIAVEVRDPSGAWIGGGQMEVPDGEGVAQIWAALIESTNLGSGYSWKTHIRPIGTTWRESVYGLSFIPFQVIEEPVNEISLSSEAWPLLDTVKMVEASVHYNALEAADLSVMLIKGDSPAIDDTTLRVETGSASLDFEFIFPTNPVPGDDYMLIAQLIKAESDSLLATDTLLNLEVKELLPELHLLSEGWPLADTVDGYSVDLSYTARQGSDISVSLTKSELIIHDTLITVERGSGALSLEFLFAEIPESGSDYQLAGSLLQTGTNSFITGDTLYKLEIVETEDPLGFSFPHKAGVGDLKIYPHPASGLLTVLLPDSEKELESISITDAAGRVQLYLVNDLDKNADGKISLDISPLRAGFYMLYCNTRLSSYSTVLIVE